MTYNEEASNQDNEDKKEDDAINRSINEGTSKSEY
jgi:hypothetical protein